MKTISELTGTKWSGRSELWLDQLGDKAHVCECTIEIGQDTIEYQWSHEGKAHQGKIALRPGGAEFTDTFHAPKGMTFEASPRPWALVDVFGTFPAGDGPEWGWRILLSHRPTGELVLQMTIVAPWGETGRAVRMTCHRA